MDQGTLEGIGTLLALLAFIAICAWAYSGRNKVRFDEAAQLPFADDLQVEDKKPVADNKHGADEIASQEITNKVGNGV